MRAFQADPLKEHQALKPVIEACIKGVTQDHLQFCLNNETNANRICLCIRNIEEHFQELGMEAIFLIHQKHGDSINMLQEPGLLTEAMVNSWIDELTLVGVWCSINPPDFPFATTTSRT